MRLFSIYYAHGSGEDEEEDDAVADHAHQTHDEDGTSLGVVCRVEGADIRASHNLGGRRVITVTV